MTIISITPYDAASFADALFILVSVAPETGQEYLYDWKDYTILKDDISEIRRNREDDKCFIALESGLSHTLPFDATTQVVIGGEIPTTNEEMRDMLMAVIAPRYIPPAP